MTVTKFDQMLGGVEKRRFVVNTKPSIAKSARPSQQLDVR